MRTRIAASLFSLIAAIVFVADGRAAPVLVSPLGETDFSEGPPPSGFGVGQADSVGPIYVNASGMTLYANGLDEPNGAFGCTDKRYEKTGGADGYPLPGRPVDEPASTSGRLSSPRPKRQPRAFGRSLFDPTVDASGPMTVNRFTSRLATNGPVM